MALNKEKKAEIVTQIGELLDTSKLIVIAKYTGTSVKSLQQLRTTAAESGTNVRVVKNRLFKKALAENARLKDIDFSLLNGQLIYAFNSQDEAAPAQNLAAFAKNEPQIEFVVGINADGRLLDTNDINTLASLPGKDQLRGQLAGIIAAPLSGLANVMAANLRVVLNVLNAKAEQ